MRYGIFADIHSNLEALEAVIQAYKKEAIDKYLCVGDVVGYAANPRECIEQVKMLALVTVAGNHDWASVNLLATDYFNPLARQALSWTAQHLDEQDRYFLEHLELVYKNEDLTLVHGTLDEAGDFKYLADDYAAARSFALFEKDVCFVGHTHVAGIFIQDKEKRMYYQEDRAIDIKAGNKYIINVGSVGQPRDGNPQAVYCIYDTETKVVKTERIDYDIQAARKKIIAAGLPGFLGDRLLTGK